MVCKYVGKEYTFFFIEPLHRLRFLLPFLRFLPPIGHRAALVLLEAAVAVDRQSIQGVIKPLELVVGEGDVPAAEVLQYTLLVARAGDGHDVGVFPEHPRQRDLGLRRLFLLGIFILFIITPQK